MIELRDERADGRAARALFERYMELVRERLQDDGFAPAQRIFATADAFTAAGGAWLVAYLDGRAVGCAGLRTLQPGVGEIKRMFVAAPARGQGIGRLLLRELEARALAAGHERVRLLTTPVLAEARALYAAEGYAEIARHERPDAPAEIWLEKELASPARSSSRCYS